MHREGGRADSDGTADLTPRACARARARDTCVRPTQRPRQVDPVGHLALHVHLKKSSIFFLQLTNSQVNMQGTVAQGAIGCPTFSCSVSETVASFLKATCVNVEFESECFRSCDFHIGSCGFHVVPSSFRG